MRAACERSRDATPHVLVVNVISSAHGVDVPSLVRKSRYTVVRTIDCVRAVLETSTSRDALASELRTRLCECASEKGAAIVLEHVNALQDHSVAGLQEAVVSVRSVLSTARATLFVPVFGKTKPFVIQRSLLAAGKKGDRRGPEIRCERVYVDRAAVKDRVSSARYAGTGVRVPPAKAKYVAIEDMQGLESAWALCDALERESRRNPGLVSVIRAVPPHGLRHVWTRLPPSSRARACVARMTASMHPSPSSTSFTPFDDAEELQSELDAIELMAHRVDRARCKSTVPGHDAATKAAHDVRVAIPGRFAASTRPEACLNGLFGEFAPGGGISPDATRKSFRDRVLGPSCDKVVLGALFG